MGREEGGGIGMGNACKSTADSCQCMAKPLQHCKIISLQLIKINEKNELKNKIKPLPIFKETRQTNKQKTKKCAVLQNVSPPDLSDTFLMISFSFYIFGGSTT